MRLVTHDGVFHADDCFAAAALLLAFPGCEIVRSRKPEVLAAADLAFDVGGGAYDHHQPGGNGQRSNGVPYASFGLVWRQYGVEVVESVYGSMETGERIAVADKVDRILVQPIDAADNGALDTLYQAMGWLNPQQPDAMTSDFDATYHGAARIAISILRAAIQTALGSVLADNALKAALADSAGGSLMVLPQYIAGWQDAAGGEPNSLLFCVFPTAGAWRVQTVPTAPGGRESRRLLPEKWAGLNGSELVALTGVADATFAHPGRFIAGATSRDGALALAALATK